MIENLGDGGRFAVDPDALQDARCVVLDVGRLLVEARLAIAAVRASAAEWTDGGILSQAVADLVATLDEAARRCQDDVIAVSDAVGRAARDYATVESRAARDYATVENGLTVRRVPTTVGS